MMAVALSIVIVMVHQCDGSLPLAHVVQMVVTAVDGATEIRETGVCSSITWNKQTNKQTSQALNSNGEFFSHNEIAVMAWCVFMIGMSNGYDNHG
jgi:hypothetical protein